MSDGIGLAEALLGLDGFRVLEVTETESEVTIKVETTADFVGCSRCGVRAQSQDRMPVDVRDRMLRAPHATGVDQASLALS